MLAFAGTVGVGYRGRDGELLLSVAGVLWNIDEHTMRARTRGKNSIGETLLSIKQVAELLGISRKTLYRYDEQGIL